MATKTICDVCQKPLGLESSGFTQVVVFSVTNAGISMTGELRLVRDGQGEDADVCEKCLRQMLVASDVELKQGQITRTA